MSTITDLLTIVRKNGGFISVRDLQRRTRKFSTAHAAEVALNELKSRGYGSWETRQAKNGRPVAVFVLEGAEGFQDPAVPDEFPIDSVETDDSLSVAYYGEKWLTKDEIIEKLDLDMRIWRVDRIIQKGWEVTGKVPQGQQYDEQAGQLAWLPTKLWKSKNRYIAINFVRRAPRLVQKSVLDLLKDVEWPTLPTPVRSSPGKCVMELSLYDIHLGKYCWARMTDQPYDLPIAVRVFQDAGRDLIEQTSHHEIDKIIIPIGHDFYQVDNWLGATALGTIVESTDDRFSKVFQAGIHAFRGLINECLKVAPVEILWIPGNHDRSTSYYLCEVLLGYTHENPHVDVDIIDLDSHRSRKYRRFGVTLLGYIHGASKDCPKDRDLPLLMATERPVDWASTIDRAWRLGHLHTKRTSIVPVGDVMNGVRIERIPSLTATDAWHWENGFTGNRRACEAWCWSYMDGLQAQYTSYAKE